MDFIDGVPLSRFIGSSKLQSLESILRMLRVIADAVGHAHSHGVVHRDLKPGNILVDANLNPHVTDFGLARRAETSDESRLTQEGLLIGTPAYMAPEQVMGEQSKVGPRSDIYSLGVIFFEMLTCRLPFEGSVPLLLAKALRDAPPAPSDIKPDLSGDVDELCLKCLKKEPSQRYATMNEVVTAIDTLQDRIRNRPNPIIEDEAWRSRVKKDKPKKSPPASDKPKRNLPDVLGLSLDPGGIILPVKAPISDQQDAKKGTRSNRTKTEQPKASQRPVTSKRGLLIGGVAALVSLIAISAFIIILLKNGNQTLAVHVDDDWLREQGGQIALLVDGKSHTISAKSPNGDDLSLTVTFGEHTFSVKHGDTIVHDPKTFEILKGKHRVVHITATGIVLADHIATPAITLVTTAPENVAMPAAPKQSEPIPSLNLTTQADENGSWDSLFDGSDVSRWASLGPFQVKDGLLTADGGRSSAISRDEYGDFELEAEWKIGPGTNSGIYYREVPTDRVVFGNEYRITDGSIDSDHPERQTGSLYDVFPATGGEMKPIGEWNTTRIVCFGTFVEHWLNGRVILHYRSTQPEWTSRVAEWKQTSGDINTFEMLPKGHLLLQSENGEIAFRSIRIRRIPVPRETDSNASLVTNSSDPKVSPPLLISPSRDGEALMRQESWALFLDIPLETENSVGIKLRLIPPGEFVMGSPPDEEGRLGNESIQHSVRLTKPFYLGATEVTQKQWQSVMEIQPWLDQPEASIGDNFPAIYVNWEEASEFCRKLSEIESRVYRLPTEAEWEYACRGGTSTAWSFGRSVDVLPEYGWFDKDSELQNQKFAREIGLKQPNPFGLFDIHGNVWEWCQDWHEGYDPSPIDDPQGPAAKWWRIFRGGSWKSPATSSRSSARWAHFSTLRQGDLGFRIVCEPQASEHVVTDVPAPANDSLKYSSQIDGATKEQLIEWSGSLPEDLRPGWISVRATESGPVFNAVAVASPDQSDWRLAFYDINNPEQSALFETHRFEYRMELIHEYDIAATTERLTVWSNSELAHWWHGDQSFINDKIQEYLTQHRGADAVMETFLPHSISGRDGHFHFVPTWQPHRECQLDLSISLDELSAKVEEYRKKGWRPKIVNSILYVEPSRYLAVFTDNPRSEKWDFSPRLTTDEYHQQLTEVDAKGGHVRCVCSRQENGEVFYTVVWDYPDTPIAKSPPIADDDFLAVAPFNTARAKKYREACAADLKLPIEFTNSIGMTFRLIPPGIFTIGSTPQEIEAAKPHLYTQVDPTRPERALAEAPRQVVTITKPFYLGTTEVTQSQFLRVTATNPSWFSPSGGGSKDVGNRNHPNAPVENMTWNAVGDFCNLLSQSEKLESAYKMTPQEITQTSTGGYRLPTEAEWEYACRAGTTTRFWCGHIVRGGDYFMSAEECRSACRDCYAADTLWNDVGFRVALSIEAVRKLNKTKKAK